MNRLSAIAVSAPELIAAATLAVDTPGEGFFDITRDVESFVAAAGAGDGILLMFMRHTSASLVIQENADPDVHTDLRTALNQLAPADATAIARLLVNVRDAGAEALRTRQHLGHVPRGSARLLSTG